MKLFFILTLFSTSALACKIQVYPYIYTISKLSSNVIKSSSNCNQHQLDSVVRNLNDIEGEIKTSFVFTDETVSPAIIYKSTLESFLNTKLKSEINTKYLVDKVIGSSHTNLLFDSEPQKISVTLKRNNAQVLISMIADKLYHISATQLVKTGYLKAKRDLDPFISDLDKNDFEYVVDFIPLTQKSLYTDYEQVRFFKPAKKILKGAPLYNHELTKKVIIHAGSPITAQILSGSIKLEITARSQTRGKIGDIINIINPKSKKRIQAKVIDTNKVLVQL